MSIECKWCRESTDTPDNPLLQPCDCTGSLGYVHEECINRWIKTSENTNCPECKQAFETKVINNGNISVNLLDNIKKCVKITDTLMGWGIVVMIFLLFSKIMIEWLIQYFLFSPCTFTKISIYYTIKVSTFIVCGGFSYYFRELTITINRRDYVFYTESLIMPLDIFFLIMEISMILYQISVFGYSVSILLLTIRINVEMTRMIVDEYVKWYKNKNVRTVYVERS